MLTAAWYSEIGWLPYDKCEVRLGMKGDLSEVEPEQVNSSARQ